MAIICHGPVGDADSYQLTILGSAEGKLAADGREVVPVVLGNEPVGFSQTKWNDLYAVCRTILLNS